MQGKLRRCYQVHKEVARKGYYEAEIPLSELDRLTDFTGGGNPSDDVVVVKFEFIRDKSDTPNIVGQLQTWLVLQCQRCLQSLDMPLKFDFRLMIDADEALVRDSNSDTLYSDNGFIDLFAVVEDELILAVPLVALHDNTLCNKHWPVAVDEPDAVTNENPFAVLRQLKTSE